MFFKREKKKMNGKATRVSKNINQAGGEFNSRIGEVSRTVDTLSGQISKGVEAAENVGESLRETFRGILRICRVGGKGKSMVKVPVGQTNLDWLDVLVAADIMDSRSDAAAYLIGEGVKARLNQLEQVAERVSWLQQEEES